MNSKTVKTLATLSIILTMGFVFACIKRTIPIKPPPVPVPLTLNTGLLLYLPFKGNFADSSGHNNPDTAYNGASLTTDEHGNANSAFNATGAGQKLEVTNNGSIQFDSAFTISFNFMLNSNNYNRQAFLSMVRPDNAYGPTFTLGTIVPYMTNFDFGVDDSTQGCDNTNGDHTKNVNDTTSFSPQPGSWYNAICIYHKGTITTYINGQFVGSKTNPLNTTALLCPASKILVGSWWDSDPEPLDGKIDEVRLYNRVLTADEISYLAKSL